MPRPLTIHPPMPVPASVPAGAPLPLWLTAGALAGVLSGGVALLVSLAGSTLAGLPWHRPLNVVASLSFGPHLAVSDGLREQWLNVAAVIIPAAALAGGLVYGLVIALSGKRPTVGLALRLGLLVGLLAWLTVIKGIAPVIAPLTVRLVPLWATLGLFVLYGAGLALVLPIATGLRALFTEDQDPAGVDMPRASSRRAA